MRYVVNIALILACTFSLLAQKPSQDDSSTRTIPCKTPENSAACYWTHGRLSHFEGFPAYRLWKIGTRRLLAIHSGPAIIKAGDKAYIEDGNDPEFPANLKRVLRSPLAAIFADFEVCPLEPPTPGAMQRACIESAKHISVHREQ